MKRPQHPKRSLHPATRELLLAVACAGPWDDPRMTAAVRRWTAAGAPGLLAAAYDEGGHPALQAAVDNALGDITRRLQ